ncbi:MAG TPA: protein kinase, partial [Planctomycetota bacterium]|nr:protein kinase [Planctomycetota bacterium]
ACRRSFDSASAAGEACCPHCRTVPQVEALGPTEILPASGPGAGGPAAPAEPDAAPGRIFAGYQIVQEVGRGGMGVVYRAVDPQLGRTVALKLMLAAEHASAEEVERFFREAASAARLRHPNIVPIHEFKVHAGRPYFTMDYIEGRSLAEAMAAGRLGVRQGVEIMEKVCRGVAHAHANGIVHRDLKPANIIVGPDGEPHVTDFGLAKLMGANPSGTPALTRSGYAMGTPDYMAPEQASGQSREVDARSDVYALGCILYEILTGRPPFSGSGAMDILRQHMDSDPASPTRMGVKVAEDVEVICLKCLEKDPARRYRDAGDLAADLRRFLDGEPITARRASIGYVVGRKLVRHRVVATVAAVAAAAMVSLTAWYIAGLRSEKQRTAGERDRAVEARHEAERQQQLAEKARQEAERQQRLAEEARKGEVEQRQRLSRELYFSNIALGRRSIEDSDIARSDGLLAGCPAGLRHWEWGWLSRIGHNEARSLTASDGRPASAVCFSPDGARLASAGHDGRIRVWEVATGREVGAFKAQSAALSALAFGAGGRLLASASMDGTVRLWDAAGGDPTMELAGPGKPMRAVAFSPDGSRVAAGGADSAVRVWEVPGGKAVEDGPVLTRPAPGLVVRGLAFSPDGARLAIAANDTTLRIWDFAERKESAVLVHGGGVTSAAWSRDGARLVSGCMDDRVRIWDARSGRKLVECAEANRQVDCVAWGPDDRQVFYAGEARQVRSMELSGDGEHGHSLTLRGHGSWVTSLAVFPAGRLLASADKGGEVKIWDLSRNLGAVVLEPYTPEEARRNHLTVDQVRSMTAAWRPDGRALVTGGADATLRVWDAPGAKLLASDRHHRGMITCVDWSRDGRHVASASLDGRLVLWGAPATAKPEVLKDIPLGAQALAAAFDPDGLRLASADATGQVRIWAVPGGEARTVVARHRGGAGAVAWFPSGDRLASGGGDGTILVNAAADGREIASFPSGGGTVLRLACRPDGKMLVAALNDGSVRAWETDGWKEVFVQRGAAGSTRGLSFSADGLRLAVSDRDNGLALLESASGREVLRVNSVHLAVNAVSFSPANPRQLAAANADGTAVVYTAEDWRTPETERP